VHALILADGDPPTAAALDTAWPGWDAGVGLVVAADGGARAAAALGLRIDVVVGDGDSLGEAALATLEAGGVVVERAEVAKDETDAELAVLAALKRGADRLTVLGALGGVRLDHELANVGLLALPALRGVPCVLLDPRARVRLLDAPAPDGRALEADLPGPAGTIVSLLPLDPIVEGITTRGFVYPLSDEPLRLGAARGISNVRSSDHPGLTIRRGRLLVVESPATLGG
jgi:thiamine pyrophosphokinase